MVLGGKAFLSEDPVDPVEVVQQKEIIFLFRF